MGKFPRNAEQNRGVPRPRAPAGAEAEAEAEAEAVPPRALVWDGGNPPAFAAGNFFVNYF